MRTFITTIFFASVLTLAIACGGGGGGGEFTGAARVSLRISDSYIDSGERILVQVRLSEINDLGIIVKVRYPSGLSYVPNTSFLVLNNDAEIDIGPTNNQTVSGTTYLVYFLSKSIFSRSDDGELEFILEGVGEVIDGTIEVDVDLDNPDVSNSSEFDSSNPNFTGEVEAGIEVVDDDVTATPTPTATPSTT